MISLQAAGGRFDYRVVGVALHEGHVLLHHADAEDFWSLPGGRCEMQEPAASALAREMQEEMDTAVVVGRLLWVVETFTAYARPGYHELGLYFLMTLPSGSPLTRVDTPFLGHEPTCTLFFQWHRLESLESVRLYPAFLRTALHAIPQGPVHVVTSDGE